MGILCCDRCGRTTLEEQTRDGLERGAIMASSGPRRPTVAAGVVVVIAALTTPAAAEVPRLVAARIDSFKPVTTEGGRPKFHIPPDSRLARDEHPRFLLTKEDLDTVRKRLADPRVAREFQALKASVDRNIARNRPRHAPDMLSAALLWRLTGEHKYLHAVKTHKRFRGPSFVFGWAGAMDLVWDDLTSDERRELSNLVAKAVSKGGSQYWRPTLPMVSVFYGGGRGPNDEFFLARMKHDYRRAVVDWTDKLNRWSAGRGGSDMGHGYNGEHAYWEPFTANICWAHATGEDYISRARFAVYQSPFYWYHFVPDARRLYVEHIGVTRCAGDKGATVPAHSGSTNLVWLSITRETDGLGVHWLDAIRAHEPPWGKNADAWGRMLWQDPDQEAIDPTTLPTTRIFPTSGHVIMRSDWTPEATFATFRCGRYGEIDGHWGRNNADNLSFTVRKRGPLAIDSGPCHYQNIEVLKFMAAKHKSMAPNRDYARQTIAHNSITIGESEFAHLDWRKRPTGDVVRRGGQSVRQAKDWWKRWGFAGPQKGFMEGRITAYRTHPLFDYICGDAYHSYPPGWVEEITREFLYLKPEVFIIYDRIVVTDPANRPCWMLHSLREPKAGSERPLTADQIGPQFVHDGKSKTPHPDPGGHFWMAGDVFTVRSDSPGKPGEGWLAVRTLIPAGHGAERKKIGGEGHDFEVTGVQHGVTEEGYKKADGSYAVLSTVGLLGWRVELRHREPSKTVEFLHVMQAGAGTAAALRRAQDGSTELVECAAAVAAQSARCGSSARSHILTVEQAGKVFEVELNRAGGRGGSLRVFEHGEAVHAGPLPGTVEDHWRHYKDDPNFRAWVTDARYRAVIEPTDEDRRLLK